MGKAFARPCAARAARPAGTGAAQRRGARARPATSRRPTRRSTCRRCGAPGWSRAREGTRVRYALAGEEALRLWLALRDASAARLAEVERAARDYLGEDVDSIGRDE